MNDWFWQETDSEIQIKFIQILSFNALGVSGGQVFCVYSECISAEIPAELEKYYLISN